MKDWLQQHWKVLAGSVLIGAALVLTVLRTESPSPTSAPFVAKVAPEVKGVAEVVVPLKGLTVYASQAKKKLAKAGAIPATAAAAPEKSVVAASQVASSERPTTVTTLVDTSTGTVETFVAPAARPWLAIENRGEVSVDYGFKRAHGAALISVPVQAARINIRQDLLEIKAFHVGVTASAYTDGDYFVGVGVGYRW